MSKKKMKNNLELSPVCLDGFQYESLPSLVEKNSFSIELEIEKYNHCHFCGGALSFSSVTHFVDNLVTENSSCSTCKVKLKPQCYRLQ